MTSPLTPMGDRVTIKPDVAPAITNSGLFLLDVSRESTFQGTVVELPEQVLPGLDDPSHFLKVGDRVLFNPYRGDVIKQDGVEFRVLNLDDIYGRLLSPVPA